MYAATTLEDGTTVYMPDMIWEAARGPIPNLALADDAE